LEDEASNDKQQNKKSFLSKTEAFVTT